MSDIEQSTQTPDDQAGNEAELAPYKPKKPKRKLVKRCLVLALEAFAVVLGGGILLLCLFIWMLSRGPITASLKFEWQDVSKSLVLSADNVALSNKMGTFMSIDEALLDISIRNMISGSLALEQVSVKGVRARVDRYKDGTFHLFNDAPDQYGPSARTTARIYRP